MNYFEHHIGDYDQATAHLSAVEDGIYSRMIRWYMADEKPLPADVSAIVRRVRAHSRDEKAAVKTILAEFFELRDDGHHQSRCDAEIARFKEKQRKAQASANARWSKSERNANASAEHDAQDMRSHMRSQCEGNAPRARPQTPDTRPNTQDQGAQPDATTLRALAEGTAEPEDPAISAGTRYGLAARAMRQAGCAATPGDPRLRQLVDQGADIAEFEAVGAEAADKGKGAAWALTALINRRADAAKVRLAPPVTGPAPTVADNPDVAATARRLAAENARAIAKPPASVLALRSRGAATTGEPT